jgi:hypothetical protein
MTTRGKDNSSRFRVGRISSVVSGSMELLVAFMVSEEG